MASMEEQASNPVATTAAKIQKLNPGFKRCGKKNPFVRYGIPMNSLTVLESVGLGHLLQGRFVFPLQCWSPIFYFYIFWFCLYVKNKGGKEEENQFRKSNGRKFCSLKPPHALEKENWTRIQENLYLKLIFVLIHCSFLSFSGCSCAFSYSFLRTKQNLILS